MVRCRSTSNASSILTLSLLGIWGLVEETSPNLFVTLDQIFADGLLKGKEKPFLGRRPIVSVNPLKFAPTYTWQTYGEVDIKRRHIGSAIHSLFNQGVLGGGEYQTVGIWAPNCPGMSTYAIQSYSNYGLACRMANRGYRPTELPESISQFVWYPWQGLCWCVFNSLLAAKLDTHSTAAYMYFLHFHVLTATDSILELNIRISPSSSQHLSIFRFYWRPLTKCLCSRLLFAWTNCLPMPPNCLGNGLNHRDWFSRSWLNVSGIAIRLYRSFTLKKCQVEAYGKANYVEPIPASPDVVASICYTSVRSETIY